MIVILNFGGQYIHLIARRVREMGVYSEIVPHNISAQKLKSLKPEGIILSGGPASVYAKNAPQPNKAIFKLGIPMLGICYGHQLIARYNGAHVDPSALGRFGKIQMTVNNKSGLLKSLKGKEQVWFSNYDVVTAVPKTFKVTAKTTSCPVAVMESQSKKQYGLQFHPEVIHTPSGKKILENFVFGICHAKKSWETKYLPETLGKSVKKTVGQNNVLLAVSGGVDSTVVAALLHQALGSQLYCVHVDHGLMRKDEVSEIKRMFKHLKVKNFKVVDASNLFLQRLKNVSDPEQKRKIIGHTFIEVFEKEAKRLKRSAHISFLAQGTIYPDRIESGSTSKQAAKIKSHHNLTLPKRMQLKILEPIKDLYKDEVRALGLQLGLPKEFIYRHPFPGPGLAVRILGPVDKAKVKILQEADAIFIDELKKQKEYHKIAQAFAALFPVKAVGVMGDSRSYEYVISLRAVSTTDFMTADWYRMNGNLLSDVSNRIVNEVRGVNRVVYDITQKPPGTVEYE
ncbi:MAG: glutamine-hydrolyzing GMP synthase [Candidatus Buchananbacteria bacterium CG10_big_fil_rev_8_21_14_0_10_42_9]|uniref:GMP synthase [glutamine-hydrolyzing] n=1 Tax=Candidatus Buchananbacteria bacterium CG10_big_fil_rev_8_21_14_0_10_42_9 TaxID=1974526 RepID=A0A2H0VZT1_9BACT|nr:MAG: glutamine-hydrolyzing GMP synthase [Candidatus Buchananbacteria bacterium CG10_big_fil_rev_8_21_14_0_10_42_9]